MQAPVRFTLTLMVLAAIALLPQSAVWATTVSGNSAELVFNNPPEGVIAVRIASPDGEVFTSKEMIISSMGRDFPNGSYQYELVGKLPKTKQNRRVSSNAENNGRTKTTKMLIPVGDIESGAFHIIDGVVVDTRNLTEY